MTITPFEMQVGPTGRGRLVVNGVDVSDRATGVSLVTRPHEVTKLTVEMVGEGPIEGLGEVTVIRSSKTLAQFLKSVDADELERVALSRVGGLGGGSLTQVMLEVLAEWADPG